MQIREYAPLLPHEGGGRGGPWSGWVWLARGPPRPPHVVGRAWFLCRGASGAHASFPWPAPPRRAGCGVGVLGGLGAVAVLLPPQPPPPLPCFLGSARLSFLVGVFCLSWVVAVDKKGVVGGGGGAGGRGFRGGVGEGRPEASRSSDAASGKERPDDSTYDAVIASLETSLDRAAQATPTPAAPRRSRSSPEYQNAIRDLLALDIDVAALLPADEPVTASTTSPSATCRRRCSTATSRRRRRSAGWRSDAPAVRPAATRSPSAGPHPGRARRRAADRHARRRGRPYTFPLDGEYEIQIRLRAIATSTSKG